MQKYRWAIIAGVCVLALIVVGALFIPKIFSSSHVEEPVDIVMPGYWWKIDLNEQQLKTLETLWGSDMTKAEFIEEVCPEILQQLPEEGVDALSQRRMHWFESWEDYKQAQMMHVGTSTGTRNEGLTFFEIYRIAL